MLYKELSYEGLDLEHIASVGDFVPALAGFDYDFQNGDHHLRSLAVGSMVRDEMGNYDNTSFKMHMSDMDNGIFGNGRDPVKLKAKYVNFAVSPYLEADSIRSVSGIGRRANDVSIPIPPLREDQVFVLRGFEFMGIPRRNHHIRTIKVRYHTDPSEIIVRFRDDSPRDDAYNFTVHYLVLNSLCDEPYNNYCLDGPFTERVEFEQEITLAKSNPGMALLSGFSFQFTRGDREIKRIAIDLEHFNDMHLSFTNRHDRHHVLAMIDYVVLKTP